MKIGFQGDIGSNAEEATKKFIKQYKWEKVAEIPLVTSKNVVSELLSENIDYGVMALTNSIIGEVVETKNALTECVELLGKIDIPIHHCVFTKSEDSKISFVASHTQALQQTVNTRSKILPQVSEVECIDTALAAKMLHDGDYPENYAVICRKNAGENYGLYLLEENIEDKPNNKTTFGLFRLKK